MSKSVPTILPGSVTRITGIKLQPVFFLTLASGIKLVVKGENFPDEDNAEWSLDERKVSIKWSSKLMKNADNKLVNTKIMTREEEREFKDAAERLLQFEDKHLEANKKVELKTMKYIWVKMPYVEGLSDADPYFKLRPSSPPKAKEAGEVIKIINNLCSDQVWKDIGRVVAVDIFNGNEDRFEFDGNWINKGNIMFLPPGPRKVIGLDTLDPNSALANLTRPGAFSELDILKDVPVGREKFALACLSSVGEHLFNVLKEKKIDHLPVTRTESEFPDMLPAAEIAELFMCYSADFQTGISEGAQNLRKYLTDKAKQYHVPLRPGLLPRQPSSPDFSGAAAAAAASPVRTLVRTDRVPIKAARDFPKGILDRMIYLKWWV